MLLTRAAGNVRMPASFMLVAATNPCPCGYFGDAERECACTSSQIRTYQSRVGGPLIDRFDLQLDVHRIPTSEVMGAGSGVSSDSLKEGVVAAREFSAWRQARSDEARAFEGFVVTMAESNELSARALVSSLRVARTIADMDEAADVTVDHLAEAFGFRLNDCFGT